MIAWTSKCMLELTVILYEYVILVKVRASANSGIAVVLLDSRHSNHILKFIAVVQSIAEVYGCIFDY